MGISSVYLDSWYLIELTLNGESAKDVRRMFYKLMKGTYKVLVSQIVLGETLAVIVREHEQERQEIVEKLFCALDSYKIGKECIIPLKTEAFDIMVSLHQKDRRLAATDIMMVAHALSDPQSKFLFTPDSKLVGNPNIIELENELRNNDKRNEQLYIKDGAE